MVSPEQEVRGGGGGAESEVAVEEKTAVAVEEETAVAVGSRRHLHLLHHILHLHHVDVLDALLVDARPAVALVEHADERGEDGTRRELRDDQGPPS